MSLIIGIQYKNYGGLASKIRGTFCGTQISLECDTDSCLDCCWAGGFVGDGSYCGVCEIDEGMRR